MDNTASIMKPLIVLIIFFLLSVGWMKVFNEQVNFSFAGKIAMCAMLILTSVGHFRYNKGMQLMLPAVVPNRKLLVYFTGVLEILAAFGLLLPSPWAERTAWFLIIFFILLMPANIYAASRHVDLEKANFEGPGFSYLWFRIPLQVVFICWVYYFVIRPG
jgi:uncharacterized membrane protein